MIIEQTCACDDTSELILTRTFSWNVLGSSLNYVYTDHINDWIISINCYYPNNTISIQVNSMQYMYNVCLLTTVDVLFVFYAIKI